MRRLAGVTAIILIAVGSFIAGFYVGGPSSSDGATTRQPIEARSHSCVTYPVIRRQNGVEVARGDRVFCGWGLSDTFRPAP